MPATASYLPVARGSVAGNGHKVSALGMLIEVRVTAVRYMSQEVNLYELTPTRQVPLPPAAPGAHIDLHLGGGLVRSYSLISAEPAFSYNIAVKREPQSRGGSRFMHEEVRAGSILSITAPRNDFPLVETAAHSIFIAGGIGITPIRSMIERLERLGRSWKLYYACRTREAAAFVQEYEEHSNAVLHVDAEHEGRPIDIDSIVATAGPGDHIYCCGPLPMLRAFEAAVADFDGERAHREYFGARQEAASSGGFTVELARSGLTVFIPPGRTILEMLLENGLDVPSSCREGLCGICEMKVLSGVPDHRDEVLSASEKESGQRMMICCSGCLGETLVLDS